MSWEHLNRSALGSLGTAIVLLDAQSCVCAWGADAERVFGVEAKQVLGKPLELLVVPRRREQLRRAATTALDGRPARVATMALPAARQAPIEVMLVLTPAVGRDPTDPARISCAVRDVTSEMRALRGLQAYEDRLQLLTERTSDGVYELEVSGSPQLVYVSPSLTRMLGVSLDVPAAQQDLFTEHVDDDDRKRIARARDDSEPWPVRVAWRRPDGSSVDLLVHEDEVLEPTGERRIQGLVIDVTPQQQVADPMLAAGERGGLTAAAVAALRQPLAAVVGYAETLVAHVDTFEPDRTRSLLERLNASAARMAGLVDDLDMMESAAEGELQLVLIELGQLVKEVAADLPMDANLELEPEVVIRGDRERLEQVLRSLLVSDMSQPKRPPARLALRRGDGDAVLELEHWQLRLDEVPDEARPAVDETDVHGPAHGLTGFDLLVARQVVAHHGGQLFVEAAGAGGSRLVVRLPLAPLTPAETTQQDPEGVDAGTSQRSAAIPLTWAGVASLVRDRIDALGLTHEQLAERANVSTGTLRRLTAESPRGVRTASLRRIADGLGLRFEELLAQLAATPPEETDQP